MRELRAKFLRRWQGLAGLRDAAPSHRSATWCHWYGGRRRGRRAWPRCWWAAAGPGRASRRRAERSSWRGRLADGPPHTSTHSGPTSKGDDAALGRPAAPQATQTRGSPPGPPRVHATRSDTQHNRERKHSAQSRARALSAVAGPPPRRPGPR